MNVGVIDLGTNSVRLFIFETIAGTAPRRLYQEKRMVRLGDGLFPKRMLDSYACEKTLETLVRFKHVLEEYRVNTVRAVATSALREAKNQDEFLSEVERKTGFSLDVISGEDEARLIAEGIRANVDLTGASVLLIDIGGGSTEVSVVQNDEILHPHSFPLGAARGQQLFLKTIPPDEGPTGGEATLRDYIQDLLVEFPETPQLEFAIGSSGSIRAIGRINHALNGRARDSLVRADLQNLINEFSKKTREELMEIPALEPKRVDLILSSTIILDQIMEKFAVDHLEITPYALKDGLLSEVVLSLE